MTSSELTNDQIIDLISDYKIFKKIIEASQYENNRRRTPAGHNNSTNLPKLSNIQFWQLATDVNNELMKRLTNSSMEESQSDCDLKRDKAQSKLSRLSDSKFHNLIFDIFTEIEKRNLHNLDTATRADSLDKGELNFYFNDSLFESIKINDDFVSVNGSIPMEVFQELRSQFVIYFHNVLLRINPAGATTRIPILLETIFKIANVIGELLSLLSSDPHQDPLQKEIIYLKSALSHAITSTRYYLTYGDLVPRIVVQSSMSELIFAFCNLVHIVKIKSASLPHDTLSDEKELDDIEMAMKPLKIIDKVRNKQKDKCGVLSKDNTSTHDNSSPLSDTATTELGTSKEKSIIKVSPSITNIYRPDTPVSSELLPTKVAEESMPSNEKKNAGFFLQLKDAKGSPTTTKKLFSRDNVAPKTTPTLKSSSPQDKALSLTDRFKVGPQLSLSHSKKGPHVINTSPVGPSKNIPDSFESPESPESPTVAKMRRFKEKLQHFGSNSGLGFRISNSEEDAKNSEVVPSMHIISLSELLEFVENRTTVVVPMVQGILSGIQGSKSKTFQTARSIPGLCQDSIKITPILNSIIERTKKVMAQENSKAYLRKHCKWIVEGLTDSLQRLPELCTHRHNLVNLSNKQFYQKLASILFDVLKYIKELVKCVEIANEQTMP